MSSPHDTLEQNGTRFGEVVVTVNLALGDCQITAPQRAGITNAPRTIRLHSLDEIRGAYGVQHSLAKSAAVKHPHASDIASALRFAGTQIADHQRKKRK